MITISDTATPPVLVGNTSFTANEASDHTIQLESSYNGSGKVYYFLEKAKIPRIFSQFTSGILAFRDIPDFEKPTDFDQNNIYEITIKLEADGLSASFDRNVSVNDILNLPYCRTRGGHHAYFQKEIRGIEWNNQMMVLFSVPKEWPEISLQDIGVKSRYRLPQIWFKWIRVTGWPILRYDLSHNGFSLFKFTIDLGICKISDDKIEFNWNNPPEEAKIFAHYGRQSRMQLTETTRMVQQILTSLPKG